MTHIVIRILLWLLVKSFEYLAWRGHSTIDARLFLKFVAEDAAKLAAGESDGR